MTDIPIIYSAPMVRSLLAKRKIMTRRLLYSERKYRVGVPGSASMTFLEGHPPPSAFSFDRAWVLTGWHKAKVGDRLWVRENWKPHSIYAGVKPIEIPQSQVFYAADDGYAPGNTPWVPSIYMLRWASRLTQIVTATKIEPLQDISNEDAIAEGIMGETGECGRGWSADGDSWFATPAAAFKALWMSLHGRDGWESNPAVVAISCRVVKANIDAPEAAVAA